MKVFRSVLGLGALFLTPLFFVLEEPWLPLIGLTCALYLTYMFFFNWNETGVSYFKRNENENS
jgi:hypothetical protein